MPELPDDSPDGTPIWLDLASSDTKASIDFYTGLFGWTFEETGPDYGNYVSFLLRGEQVAGMAPNSGGPEAWTTYLKTSDASATAAAVTANGGQVQFVDQVVELGSMVILTDPAGASVGAWQPGTHTGYGLIAEPGALGWHELHTTDYQGSLAFYTEVFGWKPEEMPGAPEFQMSTNGNPPSAGIFVSGEPAPFWLPYFIVADPDETAAKITELGGTITEEPVDTPFGRMGKATDTTGAPFSFIEMQ